MKLHGKSFILNSNQQINYICFGIVLLFLTGCFKKVELTNPNDPSSSYYINADEDLTTGCDTTSKRINLKSAWIRWSWKDSVINTRIIDTVIIERYSDNDTNTFPVDFHDFFLQKDSIDGCWQWKDTNLVIETAYKYVIWLANENGKAKDSTDIDYNHAFTTIDTNSIEIQQIKSDTSIYVSWVNSDTLPDSIRITWTSMSEEDALRDTVIDNIKDTLSPQGIEVTMRAPFYNLGMTNIVMSYGVYLSELDTRIWQREPAQKPYEMVFDPVDSLYVISVQHNINRITWRYDSVKVEPKEFTILRNGADMIATVLNTEGAKQTILSRHYYAYYDTSAIPQSQEYTIIPKTYYHNGEISICGLNDQNAQVPEGFFYVDKKYYDFDSGFYIGLYEVTLGTFLTQYNASNLDSAFFYNHSSGHGTGLTWSSYDSLQLIVSGTDSLPINSLDWYLADSMAKLLGGQLPSILEWEIAARSASYDDRPYPWGDTNPDKFRCNYDNKLGEVLQVNTLELGRVKVFPYKNIRGPYHISGNVREWTRDGTSIRGLKSYYTKGGNWLDEESLIRINSNRPYAAGDAIAGFRMVKLIQD